MSAASPEENLIALTDFSRCPKRFNELTDIWVTKFAQNIDLPGEGGTAVVCSCIDRAIPVSVRIEGRGKFVRSNHLYRDKLAGAPGEGLVHRSEGAGTEFVANIVISPEAITRRTKGRESEYETCSSSSS